MKTVELVCTQCGKRFLRLKKQHDFAFKRGAQKVLCSRECFSLSQKNGIEMPCSVCGKIVYKKPSRTKKSISGLIFCSKSCANGSHNSLRSGENHPNWINGIGSYRERAFKQYGKKCTVCGYDIEPVLEVHHRDGNREHNEIENLDVLCPTHHEEYQCGIRTYVLLPDSVIDNTFGSEPKDSRFES
jgi:hypothetical protein